MEKEKTHTALRMLVYREVLQLEAGCVWAIAGGMLAYRGGGMLAVYPDVDWIIVLSCLLCGTAFFIFPFRKISGKHINRIKSLADEKIHIYSFFDAKGYLMMFSMILLGISLRKTGLIPAHVMSYFYLFMGTPLIISSTRFFWEYINYDNAS